MTFVNDQNEVLETEGEIAITKQGISLYDFSIKGDYSVNFKVPNNSVTRRVLNYEGPQMLTQIAFTRQTFTLMRQGNPFLRGSIAIQGDENGMLDCFFMSGNSNWINSLQGLITDLDWESYSKIVNNTTVRADIANTTGVIFPYIDWAYDLKNGFHVRTIGSTGSSNGLVDSSGEKKNSIIDFYPCVYLYNVIQEAAQQNGLKLTGTLFNDPIYKSLIITPVSGKLKRGTVNNVILYGAAQALGTNAIYSSYTTINDVDNIVTISSGRITFNKSRGCTIRVEFISATVSPATIVFQSYSYLGTLVDSASFTYSGSPNTSESNLFTFSVNNSLSTGLYVEGKLTSAASTVRINVTLVFNENIQNGDAVHPGNFLPKFKSIELLKWAFTQFGCIIDYDEASKTIDVNIIENINAANAYNWSSYFVSRKVDYTTVFAQNNYQRLAANTETVINSYNSRHKIQFGEGNLNTGIDIRKDYDVFKSLFAPTYFGKSLNGCWQSNVPLVNLIDEGDPIDFSSIVYTARAGITPPSLTITAAGGVFNANEIIRLTTSDGTNLGYFVNAGGASSGSAFVYGDYQGGGTGQIRKQRIEFKTINPRILINQPNTTTTYFEDSTDGNHPDNAINIPLYDGGSIGTGLTTSHISWFCKPKTNLNLDGLNFNLAFDNPDETSYTDGSFNDKYLRRINNMIGNPVIRGYFLLPEAVFQSFKFSRLVYIDTEDLTGYFMVDSILNYKDGSTPVEVLMFML